MVSDQATILSETEAGNFPVSHREPLSLDSTLMAAVLSYEDYMQESGFSDHTIKAFRGDLRLLQRFFGPDEALHKIGNQELNQFLYWLEYERGISCSPKSYARRVTTLKSFFGWLTSIRITVSDPAAGLIHKPVVTQLPPTLTNEEVNRLLVATEAMTQAAKPDARPHLLVNLILQTGIKKAECMRLTVDDFERSDATHPTVLIRYSDPRQMHKERRLDVEPALLDTLDEYLDQYEPTTTLFECTPRNLEYVLADAARAAKVSNSVSFEALRWTCALRDFRSDLAEDKHRYKMGLSKVTWRETMIKLEKLNSGNQ